MLAFNLPPHVSFVHSNLMNYLRKDSFAERMKISIGWEIDWQLHADNFDSDYPRSQSSVSLLFDWIISSGGLPPRLLEDENGQIFDDRNRLIDTDLIGPISGIEQMAAYGLWFLDVEFKKMTPRIIEHVNSSRVTELSIADHKAECMLNAYQALYYAERLSNQIKLTSEENENIKKFDFSALGRSGAAVRHEPMRDLREYALSLYKLREWKSANLAAYELKDEILIHGRKINANLKPSNAQRTIAEWFRKKSV